MNMAMILGLYSVDSTVGPSDHRHKQCIISPMEHDFYRAFFEIEKKHWLMRARRNNILDVLNRYTGKPQHTSLLDFGCASGVFPDQLAKIGYHAVGLDGSPEAIELGRKEGIDNIGVSSGQRIEFPDDHFDVALLLDVVEHLEDPSWALK